jgi:hypothetical protein
MRMIKVVRFSLDAGCGAHNLWEDIIDGGATKEQTEYIAETARYKYKSLIYESD